MQLLTEADNISTGDHDLYTGGIFITAIGSGEGKRQKKKD